MEPMEPKATSLPAFELKYKIFLFNLIMLLAVMFIVTHSEIQRERESFRSQVTNKCLTVTKGLESILYELILEKDKTGLDSIARKLTSTDIPENDLVSVSFFDSQMIELAASDHATIGGNENTVTQPLGYIFRRPVKLAGNQEIAGFSKFVFSTTSLEGRIGHLIRGTYY